MENKIMRKIIVSFKIKTCRDCRHTKFLGRFYDDIKQNGGTNWKCNHPKVNKKYLKEYLNIDELPDWCPLPTTEENKKQKEK